MQSHIKQTKPLAMQSHVKAKCFAKPLPACAQQFKLRACTAWPSYELAPRGNALRTSSSARTRECIEQQRAHSSALWIAAISIYMHHVAICTRCLEQLTGAAQDLMACNLMACYLSTLRSQALIDSARSLYSVYASPLLACEIRL